MPFLWLASPNCLHVSTSMFLSNIFNLVCRFNKVIYELKQASRSWFLKLSATLYSLGFHSAKSDSSLFIRFQNDITLLVLIYVDDIIITRNNLHVIQHLIHILRTNYALKDLDHLHFLLGIEASWTPEAALHLFQTSMIFFQKLICCMPNLNRFS